MTAHSQKPLIKQLISSGVSGFCLKEIETESLFLALRSVAVGASWWNQLSTKEIHTAYAGEERKNAASVRAKENSTLPLQKMISHRINSLTEREVLVLIAKGYSNREIAEALNITDETVRVHAHTVFQKLNVRDRTQAAILALQQGLVAQTIGIESNLS